MVHLWLLLDDGDLQMLGEQETGCKKGCRDSCGPPSPTVSVCGTDKKGTLSGTSNSSLGIWKPSLVNSSLSFICNHPLLMKCLVKLILFSVILMKLLWCTSFSLPRVLSRAHIGRRSHSTINNILDFGDSFQLPQHTAPLPLERLNRHTVDEKLTFDADEHQYFYQGAPLRYSVTQVVKEFFEDFDAEVAVDRMLRGPNWPRPGYIHPNGAPYTRSEVLAQWLKGGQEARNRGSHLHFNIDCALNGLPLHRAGLSRGELDGFLRFQQRMLREGGLLGVEGPYPLSLPPLEAPAYRPCAWYAARRPEQLAAGFQERYGDYVVKPYRFVCVWFVIVFVDVDLNVNMYVYVYAFVCLFRYVCMPHTSSPPRRSEWRIVAPDLDLGGSVDLV
ncbi:hypothetical protein EON64_14550, partial [archaeon]